MFLLEFVMYVAPGSGLMFFIFRFIKARAQVSDARLTAARAGARQQGAEHAALLAERGMLAAQGYTSQALTQVTDALAVARTVEEVHADLRGLTAYLVDRIDGQAPTERAGRHALHGVGSPPAIGGDGQEGSGS